MPHYLVEFHPPADYDDLESLPAVAHTEDAIQAKAQAREVLENEWGCSLRFMRISRVNEGEWWARDEYQFNSNVRV